MAKIVTVISGKGGAGKTTLSVNLSCALKLLGKKTLLIDVGFGVRNDDIPLGAASNLLFDISDVITETCEFDDALIKGEKEYTPDFLASSLSIIPEHFENRFPRLLDKISHHYDYIILDTPSSTGVECRVCIGCADTVILVTTPDLLSVTNASLLSKDLNGKDTYLVINRINPDLSSPYAYYEDIIDETGAKLIGLIREDEFVSQSLEKSDPIIRYDTYAGRELENISRRLCNEYITFSDKSLKDRLFEKNRLVLKIHQGGF